VTAVVEGELARGERTILRTKTLSDAEQDWNWRRDPELATFDEALELLGSANGVGLHVDLKWHGSEAAAAEAIRRHGLVELEMVEEGDDVLVSIASETWRLGRRIAAGPGTSVAAPPP